MNHLEIEELYKKAEEFTDQHFKDLKSNERRITILAAMKNIIDLQMLEIEKEKLEVEYSHEWKIGVWAKLFRWSRLSKGGGADIFLWFSYVSTPTPTNNAIAIFNT